MIVAVAVLLSPALAFLMALIVGAAVGLLKDAGAAAAVAIGAGCIIGYLLVGRHRGASGRA